MARPKRQGLLYFPLDVDFFSDKKIKSLKARYGGDGIAFYLYMLTEVYRDKGYYIKWDADSEDNAIADLNLSEGFIKQVMEFFINRSLLTSILVNGDTIITSPAIQMRFMEACKNLKRQVEVDSEIWILKSENTATFIKFTQNDGLSKKNDSLSEKNHDKSEKNPTKEKKEKESKRKENKEEERKVKTKGVPPVFFPTDEKLNSVLNDFIEFRKKIKAPMTIRAIDLMINKLNSMTNDNNEKIAILEQSIINGWKGIFPLKESEKKAGGGRNDWIDEVRL